MPTEPPPIPDYGVPAIIIAWLLCGAALAAWLAVRIQRRRPLDVIDHAALLFLTLLGPLASFGVAYDITQYGLRRRVRQ